jgi:hypothetical protein
MIVAQRTTPSGTKTNYKGSSDWAKKTESDSDFVQAIRDFLLSISDHEA